MYYRLTIFFLSHLCFVNAQNISDFSFKPDTLSFPNVHNHPVEMTVRSKPHSLNTPINLFILVYQNYISDQFQPHCVFYPSCSIFAKDAISKYGFIKGFFLAGDRLNRCSELNIQGYKPFYKNKLLDDPVDKYK